MLPAHSRLYPFPRVVPPLYRYPHELSDAALIYVEERICLEYAILYVLSDELSCIIPRKPECHLCEVVRPEGEVLGIPCKLICYEGSPRNLYHRSDLILNLNPCLHEYLGGYPVNHLLQGHELPVIGYEGKHYLRPDIYALPLALTCCLYDRPYLHLVDLRVGNAEPRTPKPEHRVYLLKLLSPFPYLLNRYSHLLCRLLKLLLRFREELVEGRVKEPYVNGKPVHNLKYRLEVTLLHRKEFP